MDRVPRKDRGEKLGDRVHRFSQLHVYELHADKLGQNLNLNSKTLLGNAVFIGNIEINNLQTSNCIITGTTIGGWTITETKISITGMELDSDNNRFRVYSGDNYVDITSGGITGYDSVLGTTFKLLTDGSAPEFSSGVIKECVYEIYTSGVIRTNADVANNGGLIINNTEIKGYNSSKNLTLKIVYDGTDEGDFFVGNAAGNKIDWDASGGIMAIVGTITATSGLIGGFTIDATNGLYAGTGATRVQMKSGTGIWCGATAFGDAPFRVSQAGAITAESGVIAGFSLHPTFGFYTGEGATHFRIKPGWGIWCGAQAPEDAPFSVTHAGVLKATSATINGVITANTGHIGGASGWTISSKTLTGAADSIITGGIIRTSASGERIELNVSYNAVKLYDAKDAEISSLNQSSGAINSISVYKGSLSILAKKQADSVLVAQTLLTPTSILIEDEIGSKKIIHGYWDSGLPGAWFRSEMDFWIVTTDDLRLGAGGGKSVIVRISTADVLSMSATRLTLVATACINMSVAGDIGSAAEGDYWYDATNHVLKCHNGTEIKTVAFV